MSGVKPDKSAAQAEQMETERLQREEREARIWEDLGQTLREMGEEEPGW